MEYRNTKRSSVKTVDCEINHPVYGWIPFTASANDTEQYGRDIYADANKKLPAWIEPPPDLDQLSANVRSKRNQLLADSDWTQIPDAPVDQAAWKLYRQELRDVTNQSGFPTTVVWPVKP